MKQWKNLKEKTKQIKKLSTQKSIYSKNSFQNKGERWNKDILREKLEVTFQCIYVPHLLSPLEDTQRVDMFSWRVDPLIIFKCFSLQVTISLLLKFTLSPYSHLNFLLISVNYSKRNIFQVSPSITMCERQTGFILPLLSI